MEVGGRASKPLCPSCLIGEDDYSIICCWAGWGRSPSVSPTQRLGLCLHLGLVVTLKRKGVKFLGCSVLAGPTLCF